MLNLKLPSQELTVMPIFTRQRLLMRVPENVLFLQCVQRNIKCAGFLMEFGVREFEMPQRAT